MSNHVPGGAETTEDAPCSQSPEDLIIRHVTGELLLLTLCCVVFLWAIFLTGTEHR